MLSFVGVALALAVIVALLVGGLGDDRSRQARNYVQRGCPDRRGTSAAVASTGYLMRV